MHPQLVFQFERVKDFDDEFNEFRAENPITVCPSESHLKKYFMEGRKAVEAALNRSFSQGFSPLSDGDADFDWEDIDLQKPQRPCKSSIQVRICPTFFVNIS